MTREQFIGVMDGYDGILRIAGRILAAHGIADVVSVDEVRRHGDDVTVKYTYKWDWEHDGDSLTVPVDEFLKED